MISATSALTMVLLRSAKAARLKARSPRGSSPGTSSPSNKTCTWRAAISAPGTSSFAPASSSASTRNSDPTASPSRTGTCFALPSWMTNTNREPDSRARMALIGKYKPGLGGSVPRKTRTS